MPISLDEVRYALTGPVASVPTTFHEDGSIDFDGLRSFVDFTIAGGSRTMLLTYGDSLYSVLTDKEIGEVTKAVVEHTAGRAMVTAACGEWATPKAVEFARYAAGIGVDIQMLMPPNWAGSATVDTMVEHYRAVSEHIPVMMVTNLYGSWSRARAFEVFKRVMDEAPNVLAVKDDLCGDFARTLGILCHDRMALLSGGQKQNHLNQHPFGCDGYLSTFICFKPEVANSYWNAIVRNDIPAAVGIIRDYDMPYFDYVLGLTGGFDAGFHATLELFGIAKRWRRRPYYSLNDEEMAQLADFHRGIGIL